VAVEEIHAEARGSSQTRGRRTRIQNETDSLLEPE
jgi:hypothetical protein